MLLSFVVKDAMGTMVHAVVNRQAGEYIGPLKTVPNCIRLCAECE
jgi:hypothetical protein